MHGIKGPQLLAHRSSLRLRSPANGVRAAAEEGAVEEVLSRPLFCSNWSPERTPWILGTGRCSQASHPSHIATGFAPTPTPCHSRRRRLAVVGDFVE
ncbi:hypothetical protein BS78_K080100 [Paspalum vaginatum]|uniref:Uncharacterized protein n=1 Tax=Paspalum vaginatum TaxID=158149 RepID=A0A9W8CCP7_9POAL|nr:hypothetical protein BS78_K080100 [Paspalum vaginatum]